MTCRSLEEGHEALVAFLAGIRELPADLLRPHLYSRSEADAARHLFRVAAGLDSLVVGEPQILGQVKQAYTTATEHHCTGATLNRLFHSAFTAGKRVRSETALAEGAVSVSYAAIGLARKICGDLAPRSPPSSSARATWRSSRRGTSRRRSRRRCSCAAAPRHTPRRSPQEAGRHHRDLGRARSRARRRRRRRHRHRRDAPDHFTRARARRHAWTHRTPAPVPDRHRRAARRRAGGRQPRRGVPLQHRRPAVDRQREPREAQRRDDARRKRS